MRNWINIALPKGRLGEKAYDIFEAIGYGCPSIHEGGRKLIFENDILKCGSCTIVHWNEKYASWTLTRKGWMYDHFFGEAEDPEDCEIVGNIFDDSQLKEKYSKE